MTPAYSLTSHTQSIPSCIHQPGIPRGARRNPSWKSGDLLCISHTIQSLVSIYPRPLITYPNGPSCKHSSGNPIVEIAARFPTQGPFSQPTPVTREILFAELSFASAVAAFVYAAAQSPSPAAANIGVTNARREIDRILKSKWDRCTY